MKNAILWSTLVLALLCCAVATLPSAVNAVPFFRLHDENPLCFAEEIGHLSEVVVVEYQRRRQGVHGSSNTAIKVKATVVSPITKTVLHTSHLRDTSGTFTFRPEKHEVGEYDICFSAVGLGSGDGRYVELGVLIDHHDRKKVLENPDIPIQRHKAPDGEEIFVFTDADGQVKETLHSHEYLASLHHLLSAIGSNIAEVSSEMRSFHERSLRMRQTSESTFDRVWGFSVVTIGVVVVVSWLQLTMLKKFFRQKKMV